MPNHQPDTDTPAWPSGYEPGDRVCGTVFDSANEGLPRICLRPEDGCDLHPPRPTPIYSTAPPGGYWDHATKAQQLLDESAERLRFDQPGAAAELRNTALVHATLANAAATWQHINWLAGGYPEQHRQDTA